MDLLGWGHREPITIHIKGRINARRASRCDIGAIARDSDAIRHFLKRTAGRLLVLAHVGCGVFGARGHYAVMKRHCGARLLADRLRHEQAQGDYEKRKDPAPRLSGTRQQLTPSSGRSSPKWQGQAAEHQHHVLVLVVALFYTPARMGERRTSKWQQGVAPSPHWAPLACTRSASVHGRFGNRSLLSFAKRATASMLRPIWKRSAPRGHELQVRHVIDSALRRKGQAMTESRKKA